MYYDNFRSPLLDFEDGCSHYFGAQVKLPWEKESRILPLRFSTRSSIRLHQTFGIPQLNLNHLTNISKEIGSICATLTQSTQSHHYLQVRLSGDVCGAGVGRDVILAKSDGLYFDVSELSIEAATLSIFGNDDTALAKDLTYRSIVRNAHKSLSTRISTILQNNDLL